MNSKAKSLTFALTLAALWVRQIRFERRLSNRQGMWEREAARSIAGSFERQVGELEGVLKRWHKQIEEALR